MAMTYEKPAGLPVFPPHHAADGDCVLRRLLLQQPHRSAMPWPKGFEGGIAHRLDVYTSGALILADNPDELVQIRACFEAHVLQKHYIFYTHREVPWQHNTVCHAIAHDKRDKRKMVVQRGANTPHRGKWYDAHTVFTHVGGPIWRAVITTGVMHQIRVHAAFVGIVLAGDRHYGGGAPPPHEPDAAGFLLHHLGIVGGPWQTTPVTHPSWARDAMNESPR